MRTVMSVCLIIVSMGLLIPGITQPVLTITGTIEKSQLVDSGMDMFIESIPQHSQSSAKNMLNIAVGMLGLDEVTGTVEVFHKSRSILDTINELYQSQHVFVALMVGLFSVVIPSLKLLMLLMINFPIPSSLKNMLLKMMTAIGKWSMADVFVVALIIVYMAGNASAGMGDMLVTQAQFESGFYYFSGYCLLAVALQFWLKPSDKQVIN
ncbi:paraquat-inducible protein A [Shewanella intestini]|uniref:Paraquat-inducible protein A n=1 Tax=Shewanella intestini TaxID=2017544 RepID=A0ABS5I3N7_9GAMM|nr:MULTISPECIES: paraquat-inducible protein A [Shewanella]MBR9728647.1 paraquat-inducible protein A [Shewanella intestini]MRG37297.1 paraquat-inducible protein A [Shewanella sp. XMDDZSB0408]